MTLRERFEAYGWHVIPDVNGLDAAAVAAAVKAARAQEQRPSLICCKTVIGYGAPNKEGTKAAHGEALGVEEVALARKTLNWPSPAFEIPEPIRAAWDHRAAGAAAERELERAFRALSRAVSRSLPPSSNGACAAICRKTGRAIAAAARAAALTGDQDEGDPRRPRRTH